MKMRALVLLACTGWACLSSAQDLLRYSPAPGSRESTVTVASSTSRGPADYACDGVADQAQINAAIQALPATGGRVLLLEGTYNLTAAIVMKDGTWLQGQGTATILKVTAGTSGIDMLQTGATGTHDNLTISDITFDGNGQSTIQPIDLWGTATLAQNIVVSRCTIKNTINTSYGIFGRNVRGLIVSDNHFENMGDSAIELRASSEVTITGNTFVAPGALQLYASRTVSPAITSGNVTITGNTFFNVPLTITPPADSTTLDNLTITSNVFHNTISPGGIIWLRAVNGVVFSGNVFDASEITALASGSPTMKMTNEAAPVADAKNVIVSGNRFRMGSNNTGDSCYGGVLVEAGTDIKIIDNVVECPADVEGYGIKATGADTTTGLVIRGNRVIGGGTAAGLIGIDVAATAGTVIEGNDVGPWGTAIKVAATATSTYVLDNRITSATTPYNLLDTSGLFRLLDPLAFASLPADVADGSLVYCSDCTIASPCAGSGTGALAKRLNNAWVCN